MRSYGIGVAQSCSKPIVIMQDNRDTIQNCFIKVIDEVKKINNGNGPRFIVVIKKDKGTGSYATIKHCSDVEFGVPSQCIALSSVKALHNPNPQYLGNVCLKINSKIFGINSKINGENGIMFCNDVPTAIFGADISHGGAGLGLPSVCSLVCSLDMWGSQFATTLRFQSHHDKSDIITKMSEMVEELLRVFEKHCGVLPQRIIFFRDGVSESQITNVFNAEVSGIRNACQLVGQYNPPITFITCQKRHHTKFFPSDQNKDRNGNALPGTIVDARICHPTTQDFYLLSHTSFQGTCKPTHYRVCLNDDEQHLTFENIQQLCYDLCFTYSSATCCVSVVPPVYYAKEMSKRGRMYVDGGESIEGRFLFL